MSEENYTIVFQAGELREVEQALGREWLLTNGLGGFASASLLGANTRRYHGLLIAAENPPVQRTSLLSRVDEEVILNNQTFQLAVNEWEGGVIEPKGYQYLETVTLDGTSLEFRYTLPGGAIIKTLCMPYHQNAIYLNYRYEGQISANLKLFPLLCHKDHHQEQHKNSGQIWQIETTDAGFSYQSSENAPKLSLKIQDWQIEPKNLWYEGYHHRAEAERGLDFSEDLYLPHTLSKRIEPGESVTLVWWLGDEGQTPAASFEEVRATLQNRLKQLEKAAGFDKLDEVSRWLFRAADQFVVTRPSARAVLPPDVPDRSVIAGYHWFSDWGRDTMIALPGLVLTTGRYTEAAGILRTFAAYLDKGMLPNRFPDSGEEPEYNTVDATLWFFQAIYAYYSATKDLKLVAELYPKLSEIIEWHQKGTRYQIKVDQSDSLLHAGEAGVQLTWMDVKIGDWVVTPRVGKPVEINALWCNALGIMQFLASELKQPEIEINNYVKLREQVLQSFLAKFWYAEEGFLYDVIDSEDVPNQYIDEQKRDCTLRPNQLFAISLPFGPFAELNDELKEKAASILDVCAKSLLTDYGMRTLSPNDLRYYGRFTGNQKQRDAAYHQGTIWPWPIGAFVEAHYRIYKDKTTARAFLEPLIKLLREGGLGSINEVYDADAPHRPLGCIAQAWSVSELLRLWVILEKAV